MTDEEKKEPAWVKIVVQLIATVGLVLAAWIAVPKAPAPDKPAVTVNVNAPVVTSPPSGPTPTAPAPTVTPTVTHPSPTSPLPTRGPNPLPMSSTPQPTARPLLRESAGTATLDPCPRTGGGLLGLGASDCSEASATRTQVCAAVPVDAQVVGVDLFTKWASDPAPWGPSNQVQPGQDAQWCRFYGERAEKHEGGSRLICWPFAHWSSHQARVARVLVRYR